jgi:hypothetical protein
MSSLPGTQSHTDHPQQCRPLFLWLHPLLPGFLLSTCAIFRVSAPRCPFPLSNLSPFLTARRREKQSPRVSEASHEPGSLLCARRTGFTLKFYSLILLISVVLGMNWGLVRAGQAPHHWLHPWLQAHKLQCEGFAILKWLSED